MSSIVKYQLSQIEVINEISKKLNLKDFQVKSTLSLSNDDNTVHFIARYRKEMTGNLTEDSIRDITDLNKKIDTLIKAKNNALVNIDEQGKLTPELEKNIITATTLSEVEDLYAPYKRKRKTKADLAREKGFDIVAEQILAQNGLNIPQNLLDKYSRDEIISGAQDIISQDISDNVKYKNFVRSHFQSKGTIVSKMKKLDKIEEKYQKDIYKFQIYKEFSNQITKLKSYQTLALNRGESLGILSVKIEKDENFYGLFRIQINTKNGTSKRSKDDQILDEAIKGGYIKLFSSVENEIRNELTEKAGEEAIKVFQENLNKLLMLKPHNVNRLLAIDPGFRTGCKICLIENGMPTEFSKIYLHSEKDAIKILNDFFTKGVDVVVIGNGTGSNETNELIANNFEADVFIVNESGASVYSTSEIGKDEFPDLDATDRGTISIGRRFIDSLSELVKVPVISIGVGMYQHDMNQKALEEKLTYVVEDVVNLIGINVNTASPYLLTYVSGLTKRNAKKIFNNKPYKTREKLKKVLSEKAYQQAVGFLRVPESDNEFENTGIHPEQYKAAEIIIKNKHMSASSILSSFKTNLELAYPNITEDIISDILRNYELAGQELRQHDGLLKKNKAVNIDDLSEGDKIKGVVRNVTQFGAFVDIGLKNDALIHISQLANRFVKDPLDVVEIGQEVNTKIIKIDLENKRVQLSLKDVN